MATLTPKFQAMVTVSKFLSSTRKELMSTAAFTEFSKTATFRLTDHEQPFILCIDCWWRS